MAARKARQEEAAQQSMGSHDDETLGEAPDADDESWMDGEAAGAADGAKARKRKGNKKK